PRFEPTRAAIVDTSAHVPVADLSSVPAAASVQTSVTLYRPGQINVRFDRPVPSGAALVVSENYFPGWLGFVDGRSAPVTRANYNLMAVVLPTGARDVRLQFVDSAYETGKTITLIALALAVAAAIAGVALDRRRAVTAA